MNNPYIPEHIAKQAMEAVSGGLVEKKKSAVQNEQYMKFIQSISDSIRPSLEKLEEADEEIGILVFVRGVLEDNREFYAYLSVMPSMYQEFIEAERRGNYDLEDYGDIIAMGEGREPPEELVKEMREKFGADPDFEKKLLQAISAELDKLSKQEN